LYGKKGTKIQKWFNGGGYTGRQKNHRTQVSPSKGEQYNDGTDLGALT